MLGFMAARKNGQGVLRARLKRLERRLRDVEQRYELVMGAINESVYEWDIARDRFTFSESMQRVIGVPPDMLRTIRDWQARVHPEDFAQFRAATIAHLKGETAKLECDYRYRRVDGTWRWARTHGLALRDRSGRARRLIGSTGDITELKERERELAEQKTILETTLENIDQGITMVDRDLRTIALNRKFLELLRFPPERFARGFHMAEAFRFNAERGEYGPGEVEDQVRQRVELARRFEEHSFERVRPDGTVIAVRGKPLPGGGFVSTYTDVTAQRRTQEVLRRSEERYALATSAATEGIYEWNVASGALFLTERAKAFFSITGHELTPAAWNTRVHADDFPAYRAALIGHFKGRTAHLEVEYRIADGGGGYKWVIDRGIGVRDGAGRVTRLVGALTDITERKRAELDLRRARDDAQQALEQQTATAEILRVMASSPSDVQPVFEAIVRAGVRLFPGAGVTVTRPDNGQVQLMAIAERDPQRARRWAERFPFPLAPDCMHGRAILECRMIDMPDVERMDDSFAAGDPHFAASGYRAMTVVPMVRDGAAIGTIAVVRDAPGALSDKQVALLKTFADEAVIAIENVRLFNETREALEHQKAHSEVLQAISGSIADTQPVFDKILESCERLFSGRIVGLNVVREDGKLHIGAFHGARRDEFARIFPIPLTNESGSGLAIVERRVVHYPDTERGAGVPARTRQGCKAIGIKSAIFAPVLWEERGLGAIFVGRDHVSSFSEKEIALLKTFADQAAIAIENARLFRDIQDKSRQLEIASRHKSEFLANMSHELRTPLNAIIGFTRIVMRRSQDTLETKQYENLEKILASAQSLLALINAILDLSKIEAGRIEVRPAETVLGPVLEQCLRTVEPLAKVPLVREFDGALPAMYVDEEKLRQIVLNLLGNAAKFTERGDIRLKAQAANGSVAIMVADTGVGIPTDKLGVIFEEFEQVDASSTRAHGGTGLGLAIARRLARLMGGDIHAESVLGTGSTFTLTLPLRHPA